MVGNLRIKAGFHQGRNAIGGYEDRKDVRVKTIVIG